MAPMAGPRAGAFERLLRPHPSGKDCQHDAQRGGSSPPNSMRMLAERRRMAWPRLGSGRAMAMIAVELMAPCWPRQADQFAFLGGLPLPCFFCACGSAGFAFFACFARRRWRALVGSIGLPGE